MTTSIYGWCGKILKIDLSESRISELKTMDYADRFLGGRGIATRIYWEEVGPSVSAFDPENHLILMTGPLGATGAQGASRFEVVGKSPMLMPEGFCYGNLGGFFGPYLKKAGYDGVVISGRSAKPVYLWIHDGEAQILEASLLWGKGVYGVRDILKKSHGKNVRFVTTGVAGENMCRSANLMTDNEGSATGGFGAVMGSKKLKAIAAAKIIDRTYVKDSLLLCDSAWPLMVSWNTPDHVGDPTLESRIFSAVTGIETDETELNQYGEKIFNLQRRVLLREGRRPKVDDVPEEFNFVDPVEAVFMNPDVIVPGPGEEVISRKGQTLDKEVFEEMRKEFYELRGWDSESGSQKVETLERLGLSDLV